MKPRTGFRTLSGAGAATGAHAAEARPASLIERLSQRVGEPFARMTGQTVMPIPLETSDGHRDEAEVAKAVHPLCDRWRDDEVCRESRREHLAELGRDPKTHWHRCEHANWCSFVPVFLGQRLLAACKLVCPGSMSEEAFRKNVELLDLLCESFSILEGGSASTPAEDAGSPGSTQSSPHTGLAGVGPGHHMVATAMAYIEQRLSDPELTVERIARNVGANTTYLGHVFSQRMGIRMKRYIATRRVELAKKLLATTDLDVKQIAYACGCHSRTWFQQMFRTHAGTTPGQYRRGHRRP